MDAVLAMATRIAWRLRDHVSPHAPAPFMQYAGLGLEPDSMPNFVLIDLRSDTLTRPGVVQAISSPGGVW
jgi:hypothetical protein